MEIPATQTSVGACDHSTIITPPSEYDQSEKFMKNTVFASCVAFLLALTTPAVAEDKRPAGGVSQTAPTEHYVAGLGEIMAETQMRHAKLWLAGNAGNWGLADYELGEIEEGFENVTKFHPVLNDLPLATLLNSITRKPLTSVRNAIESKDKQHFNNAFIELTAACNSCHTAANRKFIVITTPSVSPVSNQQYAIDTPG